LDAAQISKNWTRKPDSIDISSSFHKSLDGDKKEQDCISFVKEEGSEKYKVCMVFRPGDGKKNRWKNNDRDADVDGDV
jgi:hypothetical protein